MDTKVITIEHDLTDDEINIISRKNAQRDMALMKIEDYRKSKSKKIKNKMKIIDERRMEVSMNILSGKASRNVRTHVDRDYVNRKIYYRHMLTGEILKTEKMPADMQEGLY